MKRFLFLIPLLIFLAPQLTWGVVAYDNSDTVIATAVDTVTISNFVVATTNPFILCSPAEHAQSLVDVTYNSVSMDVISQLQQSDYELTLMGKQGLSGTHDVVVIYAGVIDSVVGCISFTGVDQATPNGTAQTSLDYTSVPISLTVPTDGMGFNSVMDSAGDMETGCATYTATSQTKRFEVCPTGAFVASAGATIDVTTANLFWEPYMGGYLFQIGIPINPAAAVSSIIRRHGIIQ
jgi:hypothetical protein